MADIFISYAREDIEFTRNFNRVLEGFGHKVWVDWSGIEPSVDWRKEIEDAIASVDAVVFVLSPASLDPNSICHEELSIAERFEKRLVPVLCGEPEGDVPESLGRPDWIDLRGDHFSSGGEAVNRALNLDLERYQAHKRLLLRARDWEARDEHPSLLLRGRDLIESERWFADPDPHPRLVAPQPAFLQASRVGERRRLRRVLGAVSLALVVTVALAAATWWQSQQRELQRKRAVVRQLAAEAELVRDQRGEGLRRSTWIAAEALTRSLELGEPSLTANRALRRGLQLLRHRLFDIPGSHDVALSSDGLLLTVASSRIVAQIDLETQESAASPRLDFTPQLCAASAAGTQVIVAGRRADKIARFSIGEDGVWTALAPPVIEGAVTAAAFGRNGKAFALADEVGITVYVDGEKKFWIHHTGRVRELRFDTDDRHLITESGRKLNRSEIERAGPGMAAKITREVWSLEVPADADPWDPIALDEPIERAELFIAGNEGARVFDFSNDGLHLATITSATGPFSLSHVGIFKGKSSRNGITFNLAAIVQHPRGVNDIAFAPDGATLATASRDFTARLWVSSSGDEIARFEHSSAVNAVAFSSNGELLVSAGSRETRGWQLAGREPLQLSVGFAPALTVRGLTYDPRGLMLASITGTALELWNVVDGERLAAIRRRSPGLENRDAIMGRSRRTPVFTSFSKQLIAGGRQVIALPTDRVSGTTAIEPMILSELELGNRGDFEISATGRTLVSFDGTMVTVIRLPEATKVESFPARRFALSPGEDRLLIADDTLQLADLAQASVDLLESERVDAMIFNPDGSEIAYVRNADLCTRRLDAVREVSCFPLPGRTTALIYDPGGAFLATADREGPARIYDASSGEKILEQPGETRALRFSPTGRYVAISTRNEGVTVFDDWQSGAPRVVMNVRHGEDIRTMAFSPEETHLATGGNDARIRIWVISPEALLGTACDRLEPVLTNDDWTSLIGDDTPVACSGRAVKTAKD